MHAKKQTGFHAGCSKDCSTLCDSGNPSTKRFLDKMHALPNSAGWTPFAYRIASITSGCLHHGIVSVCSLETHWKHTPPQARREPPAQPPQRCISPDPLKHKILTGLFTLASAILVRRDVYVEVCWLGFKGNQMEDSHSFGPILRANPGHLA